MKNHTRYLSIKNANPRHVSRRNGRRKGYVAILVALSWLALCGVAALSFDLSRMYTRKAEAQKAADASSLVGAAAYGGAFDPNPDAPGSDSQHLTLALAKAKEYAALNGYDVAKGATVNGAPGTGAELGLYRVTLSRPEPVYFARVFFGPTMNIFATAASEYTKPQNVPLQNYGAADGPISLSAFGPNALKEWGDPFSPKYASSLGPRGKGGDKIANPEYHPGGYNFNVQPAGGVANFVANHTDASSGKAIMQIEIYDPGSNNAGDVGSAQRGLRVDEYHSDGWGGPDLTTTKYTLTYDGVEIDSKSFGPGNQGPDMAWDKTFQVDLKDPKYQTGGTFNVNVITTDGMSENGFNLRAGPLDTSTMTDAQWVTKYGNVVSMSGKESLPMNFNDNGNVTIDLGQVAELKRGGKVFIEKFDLDVQANPPQKNTVTYYDNGAAKSPMGSIPDEANGVWAPTDIYTLPENYPGGHWTALYSAGRQDTSVWRMKYTGPGNFRLVR